MIPELANLLRRSIEQCLEDRVAIAFSGGIDSTLIAHITRQYVEVELFVCGTRRSEDVEYAEKAADALGLKLNKLILSEGEIIEIYNKCRAIAPNDLLKVELLVAPYKTAVEAKKANHSVILFGSGSEELFVGYERYYTYHKDGKDLDALLREEFSTLKNREIGWIKKICYKHGIEARFPFYNEMLAQFVFSIPLEIRMAEKELKKGILRDAAKMLGLPEVVLKRKKRAMQYGSGIHNVLLRHKDQLDLS